MSSGTIEFIWSDDANLSDFVRSAGGSCTRFSQTQYAYEFHRHSCFFVQRHIREGDRSAHRVHQRICKSRKGQGGIGSSLISIYIPRRCPSSINQSRSWFFSYQVNI